MGCARYDEKFRFNKEWYPTSSWEEVDFELWVMLKAQDQGQPPTTDLYRESKYGNQPLLVIQRKLPRGGSQESVQSTTMIENLSRRGAPALILTTVPVHLTPTQVQTYVYQL